jgi:hypothetical protein
VKPPLYRKFQASILSFIHEQYEITFLAFALRVAATALLTELRKVTFDLNIYFVKWRHTNLAEASLLYVIKNVPYWCDDWWALSLWNVILHRVVRLLGSKRLQFHSE